MFGNSVASASNADQLSLKFISAAPGQSGRAGQSWKIAFVLACCLAVNAAVFAQPATRPAFPAIRLPARLQGEAAINALSNQLPAIAAFYRHTPQELQNLLRRDRSLWVDRDARLFYVCDLRAPPEGSPSTNNIPPPGEQLQPLDQTFHLHSKPGANHLIYLDFVGFTISGTAWNVDYNGGADIVAPPFDVDGDPMTFGSAELTGIQQIWLRVAEDYSLYDVDVTTEYPGEAALTRSSAGDQQFGTRALISPIGSFFGNPGGIAYVGVYDDVGDFYKPALIFPENLANSEKYIAEAISHEVGHNLGLSHDGQNIGATHVEYYQGQGNWAPIMGVGYYHPISQWSKGEYPNPSNTEDDLSVITQNGLTYRADDFGNTIGAATPLFGTSIVTNGVIERTNDVDFFSFQTGAGTAQITATPSERGANLHILLSVYNSGGILITNADVAAQFRHLLRFGGRHRLRRSDDDRLYRVRQSRSIYPRNHRAQHRFVAADAARRLFVDERRQLARGHHSRRRRCDRQHQQQHRRRSNDKPRFDDHHRPVAPRRCRWLLWIHDSGRGWRTLDLRCRERNRDRPEGRRNERRDCRHALPAE
jgi:hypothetical protein